jgi:two-component system chemotaxis sensor kinase CheA
MIQMVVFSHNGAHVGLIVDQILDIVEDSLANPRPPGRPGVLGSVVIAGRVTELLDVEALLRRAQPGAAWATASSAAIDERRESGGRGPGGLAGGVWIDEARHGA